ncbi:hypothetical protein DSECCO2_477760 [anaerobic digester metagenome]
MDKLKSWIYVDYVNNIWKLSVNSVKELLYSTMNKDGKWTEEKLIDQDVLGYCIYAANDEVHIIYCNTNAELKYCTFIEKQWMGKTLYKLDNKKVEINDLNVILTNEGVHIFYLLRDKKSNGHGILMHCKWNGVETNVSKLQDVIIASDLNEHYIVYLDEKNNIEILFFSDEGNEVSLNRCSYKNRRWTEAIRLYGISGHNIEIKILKDQYDLHIVNKCQENTMHYLVHVFIKKNGDIYKSSIHESNNILSEVILLKEDNIIYSYWIEDNKVYSSIFRGKDWSNPICIVEDSAQDIKKYNFIELNNDIIKEVYWIGEEDLNLIVLGKKIQNANELLNTNEVKEIQENLMKEEIFKKDDEIKRGSLIKSLKSENKSMKETIETLRSQLQSKQNILDEYEEQISKMVHYKQKTEDNYNIFIEVQHKLQNEIEELKRLYTQEKEIRVNVEMQSKKLIEDKEALIEQTGVLIEKNDELIEKNARLSDDNDRLSIELENIKNKTSGKGFWKFK